MGALGCTVSGTGGVQLCTFMFICSDKGATFATESQTQINPLAVPSRPCAQLTHPACFEGELQGPCKAEETIWQNIPRLVVRVQPVVFVHQLEMCQIMMTVHSSSNWTFLFLRCGFDTDPSKEDLA